MRAANPWLRPGTGAWLGVLLSACASADTEVGAWQKVGHTDWRSASGIVAAGPNGQEGYLVSNRQFRDFTLIVEVWIDKDTNSGIFVRCRHPADINPDDCYEINFWDDHPRQAFRTGSIVKRQSPLERVNTAGKWNRCRIDVRGNQITVTINAAVTARLEDVSLEQGYIALQYGGTGVVRFRDLQISED